MEILEAYQKMPYLRSTVQKIAGNAARVPGRLYSRTKKGKTGKGSERAEYVLDARCATMSHDWKVKEIKALRNGGEMVAIDRHPMLDLLASPMPSNPQFSGRTLMFLTYAWLDLVGDAFWAYNTNNVGMPTEIFAIPPDWVREIPTRQRPYFVVTIEGGRHQIPVSNMLWFKDPTLTNPYGRGAGVGHALADELDVDENAAKHLSSFFYNRAMPDMLVSIDGADEDQLLATKTKFEQDHRGITNAYRSAFVNGKINVARLDTSFREMDLVSLRKFSGREIVVQAFGLSPEMLGILDNSNRATVYEARAMFAENVLLPRLDLVEAILQTFAGLFDERLVFCFDDPKPDDINFVLEVTKAHGGAFTENEKRALANLDPVEGGDVYRQEDGKVVERLDAGIDVGTGEAVSDTALNGTQTSSFLLILAQVLAGTLPKASARAFILEAFPSFEESSVDAILAPIVEGSQPIVDPKLPKAPVTPDVGGESEKRFTVRKAVRADDVESILEALRPDRLTTETSDQVVDLMEEIGTAEAALVGSAESFTMLNPLITEYVETYGATRITGFVNETTRAAIRQELVDGVRAGEDVRRLALRVRNVFDDADRTRAVLIARTEVVGASNRAIYAAHVMSGVVKKRQWVGTGDGRSRKLHAPGNGLAGQVRPIGEEFVASDGRKSFHPGGFGDPDHDCDCRCVTVALVDEPKSAVDLEILQRDFESRISPYEEKITRAFRRGFKAQRDDVLDALSNFGEE